MLPPPLLRSFDDSHFYASRMAFASPLNRPSTIALNVR